jgi:hypothetical protein
MLSFVIKRFIKAGRKKTPSGCTLIWIQPDGAFATMLVVFANLVASLRPLNYIKQLMCHVFDAIYINGLVAFVPGCGSLVSTISVQFAPLWL